MTDEGRHKYMYWVCYFGYSPHHHHIAPKPRRKHSTGAACSICLVFVHVFALLLAIVCVVMLATVFPVVCNVVFGTFKLPTNHTTNHITHHSTNHATHPP
jgi:hypothetical protein